MKRSAKLLTFKGKIQLKVQDFQSCRSRLRLDVIKSTTAEACLCENRGTFKMVQDITFEARAEFPVFVQLITNQLLLRPTLEMVEIGGLALRPAI